MQRTRNLDSRKSLYRPPAKPPVKHQLVTCFTRDLERTLDDLFNNGHHVVMIDTSNPVVGIFVRPNPTIPWKRLGR